MNGTYAVVLSVLVLCQISAGIAGFVKDRFLNFSYVESKDFFAKK